MPTPTNELHRWWQRPTRLSAACYFEAESKKSYTLSACLSWRSKFVASEASDFLSPPDDVCENCLKKLGLLRKPTKPKVVKFYYPLLAELLREPENEAAVDSGDGIDYTELGVD